MAPLNPDTEMLLHALLRSTTSNRLSWTESAEDGDLTARSTKALFTIQGDPGHLRLIIPHPLRTVVTSSDSPHVAAIEAQAHLLARMRRKTLTDAAQEIHLPQQVLEGDDDGVRTLIQALGHATRNHKVEWHQIDDPFHSSLTARCAWLDLHISVLTMPSIPIVLDFTATLEAPHPPVQLLLASITEARAETLRELSDECDGHEPAEPIHTLLTSIL